MTDNDLAGDDRTTPFKNACCVSMDSTQKGSCSYYNFPNSLFTFRWSKRNAAKLTIL